MFIKCKRSSWDFIRRRTCSQRCCLLPVSEMMEICVLLVQYCIFSSIKEFLEISYHVSRKVFECDICQKDSKQKHAELTDIA